MGDEKIEKYFVRVNEMYVSNANLESEENPWDTTWETIDLTTNSVRKKLFTLRNAIKIRNLTDGEVYEEEIIKIGKIVDFF